MLNQSYNYLNDPNIFTFWYFIISLEPFGLTKGPKAYIKDSQ